MAADSSLLRSLIDRDPDEVELDELRAALLIAGDEDDQWEAKGARLRPEHVYRSVAALANRTGGLVILGASRREGAWELDGVSVTGELGPWIVQAIRDNLRPVPPYHLQVYDLPEGRFAALVRVECHPEHLVATGDGKVLRREHGRTVPVADGAELTWLVQERTAPPRVVDIDLPPTELAAAVTAAANDGRMQSLRPAISGLGARIVRAAELDPVEVLDETTDRLCALCAALAAAAPESELTTFALEAHHRAFDAAGGFAPIPTAMPDLDLYRSVLRSARAVGALLVRLGLWAQVRTLARHPASGNEDVYPGWITFFRVREERARMQAPNAEVIRFALRRARETVLEIPALRPDGADEHQVLDSVLNFEFLAALVELDECSERGMAPEIFTDFAAFAADPQHSLVSRLSSLEAMREVLLPGRSQIEVALLLLNLEKLARKDAGSLGDRTRGASATGGAGSGIR